MDKRQTIKFIGNLIAWLCQSSRRFDADCLLLAILAILGVAAFAYFEIILPIQQAIR